MNDYHKIELEVKDFWKKNKINEKLLSRKGKKFFLLDGPPYANFIPHVGHIKNTVFKDLIIRSAFMKGYQVYFKPGFDTHGLPVENMVEKKLGLQSKKDIETFGIAKFMKECKSNAAINKDLWMQVYERLGSLYALKDPYLTYENYYLDSGWWSFARLYEKDLVYEGEKPVMWCPHCQTSLAGYEVTDSYKEVQDPGIYVSFKLKDQDASLLVYTTTPWTLPANVAIAVASKEDYVKIDIAGKKLILAEKRLQKISEIGFAYNILEKFKGERLVGKKYEPLLDVPLQKNLASGKLGKAHEVIASLPLLKERVASKVKAKKITNQEDLFEEFVTMNEGSGFVHTAPGHGKTDYIIGQHYGLACVSPVDESCQFTEESGFSGFVKKADKDIISRLENEGKMLHHETITHSYPLCWRCKSTLIFRLSKQLFLKVSNVKKTMQKENKKVNWLPDFARERFNNWIDGAEDWNISRQRYWGIPIPLWQCEGCGKKKVIESKKELEKLSGRKIDDLHAAGEYEFSCTNCNNNMKKTKGVLDVWFDSGIAPWASFGYPYENKKEFDKQFPVDRINEAQDQIRGWFYSLMFCSSAIFNKSSYKSVSMVGWVLDKNGNKMSKSQGNVVTGEDALQELGADILRYYFCWDVSPYETQKFNIEIAKKEIGKVFTILTNLVNLASNEKMREKNFELEDKWIISRLNNLITNYSKDLDNFEAHSALRLMSDFIMNDLSRSYVQMTRDKEEQGKIISLCLPSILKLLAPIAPFITEKIWQDLRNKGIVKEESVHLSYLPKPGISNKELEREFSEVLKIIELGLAERDKVKIGLRWPLASATVFSSFNISKDMQKIIMQQLNVKKIECKKNKEEKVELDAKMTQELEAEGFARELCRKIQSERKKLGLKKGDLININIKSDRQSRAMFEKNLNFIKERTNTKEIYFSDDKTSDKDIVFTIKEKNIGIFIRNS